MKWHPSSLGKLMTASRTKSEVLSETTKTYIRGVAKQDFYGYNVELNNKYINKGKMQENDSIALLNTVNFTSMVKNTERLNNEWLTGEADIVLDDQIIDIKTSWSLETFPATSEEGINKDYEWQLRAYMALYDKSKAELIYCMVTTSNELLNEWENLDIHRVDHIAPEKRITVLSFERNEDKEIEMLDRLKWASEYYDEYYSLLEAK